MHKNKHKFPYCWKLKDTPAACIEKHNTRVFSCFAAGGGSSLGYKLAGYDVVGMNEIDLRMAECYQTNLKLQLTQMFIEDIKKFKTRSKQEILKKIGGPIDILDGSPPCSTFSMSGKREKKWGVQAKFAEGQTEQILDTLFFDFLEVVQLLTPKFVIAENVAGILMGNAIKYVARIHETFDKIGYYSDHALLNAANMGVPQTRNRVIFIAVKKTLAKRYPFLIQTEGFFNIIPSLNLKIKEPVIKFKEIDQGFIDPEDEEFERILPSYLKYWKMTKLGNSLSTVHPKGSFFNGIKIHSNLPCNTVIAQKKSHLMHHTQARSLSKKEIMLASSWPLNYDFCNQNHWYVCGMSVPPVMMAQIAHALYEQYICKMKQNKKRRKRVRNKKN